MVQRKDYDLESHDKYPFLLMFRRWRLRLLAYLAHSDPILGGERDVQVGHFAEQFSKVPFSGG